MAAHRYWRALSLEAYGVTGLNLTEFQLLVGTTRVDAGATLTSTIAPATGSLANLKDDDLSTGATWLATDISKLALNWDFGSGGDQDVSDIRLGSADGIANFLLSARIQYSDNSTTWTDLFSVGGILYPGDRTKTSSTPTQSTTVLASSPLVYYKLDETSGTSYTDSSGNGRTGVGSGGTITPQSGLIGDSTGSQKFVGTASQILTTDPFGTAYAGGWSCRAVGRGPSAGFTLVERGRDTFGAGWSINLGVSATTGAVGVSMVAAGITSQALSAAGLYNYTDVVELAATYQSQRGLRCYMNGVQVGFTINPSAGAALRDSTIGLTVGMGNGVTTANTEVDEVAWWNRTLAPDEIYAMAVPSRILTNTFPRGRTALTPVVVIPTSAVLAIGNTVVVNPIRGRNDYLTGVTGQGIGRVSGTVAIDDSPDIPVKRRVRLYRQRDGLLIEEKWSDPITGAFSFDYIDELQTYFVISFDHTGTYPAVCGDNLVPDLIP